MATAKSPELRLHFRLVNHHQLNTIDQFPVPAFETSDDSSRWRLQTLFQARLDTPVRAVIPFGRVKRNSVDVIPIFDRDAGDKFARFQRKRVNANVPMPSCAPDFRQSRLVGFQQYAVDVSPMPNRHARDASRRIGENTVWHAAGPAAFFAIFLCRDRADMRSPAVLRWLVHLLSCHRAILTSDPRGVK